MIIKKKIRGNYLIGSIIKGIILFFIVTVMWGCNKYSESDLDGTWVYTVEHEGEDEGVSYHFTTEDILKFNGDKVTHTFNTKTDGVELYSQSIEGTYKYEEPSGGFDNSKAVGIIIINYDLDTIENTFHPDANEADKEKLKANWRQIAVTNNMETQFAKSNSSDKKNYYGLMVMSIDKNEMIIDTPDEPRTYHKKF